MNVETLRGIINNPATTPNDQQAAIATLRTMAQGGAAGVECEAARKALAQIGQKQGHAPAPVIESLESELLREAGARRLRDVEYSAIQAFCAVRSWTPEVWIIYYKWVGSDVDRIGVVLKAYLALHFGARATAKHLISNVGKRWPYHSCNRDAVKDFLDVGPDCKDAETVCREYLETGHVTKLPEECECWRLTRAIERADREKNPHILIDELSQLPETHPAESARNADE